MTGSRITALSLACNRSGLKPAAACSSSGLALMVTAATIALGLGAASAQEQAVPLIDLGLVPEQTQPELPPPAPPNAGAGAASTDQSREGGAPQILLPPPYDGPSEATTPDTAEPAPSALAEPVVVARDRGEGDASANLGWLIRPRPEAALPTGVQVGASLPAPGVLRLTGETAEVALRLELPPVSPLPDALQLTLHSSVNVLPEAAVMQVIINGAEPVELPLDRLGDFSTVTVPTDALVVGNNSLYLKLAQPHRIFCGPEASFGVWTEISLGQSGVVVPPKALAPDATGFALAASSQTAGGRSLVLLVDEHTDAKLVRSLSDRLSRAIGAQGRVELRSFYTLGPQPIASVALISSDAARAEIRQGAGGGLVLQIEHKDGVLPDLSSYFSGFKAQPPTDAPALVPGVTTRFAQLDSPDIIGNTRYFRRDIPFTLPSDWLLMANQKARLDLHYGFARGLPEGAILLVKINGNTIRLLPLDREGGEVQPMLPVGFNANLLRPGRNHLSFEMMVPGDPPDAICPARRADLLVVLEDSSLTIPPSPSMVLPGLASALLRLDPTAVTAPPEARDQLLLQREAMQIAEQLTASGDPSSDVGLQIVGLNDFGLVPLEESGLNLSAIQTLLFPPLTSAASADAGAANPANATAPRSAFTLSEEAAPDLAPAADSSGAASGLFRDLWNRVSPRPWLSREYNRLRESAFVGTSQSLASWLEGRSGTALLLRPDYNQQGALWLLLGPGVAADEVGRALNELREDALAQGEAAVLQADGSWQVWTPIRPPTLMALPNAGALRTVLGNYASWSPLLFTLAMLGMAMISALPALFYVLLSRRRRAGS